MIFAEPMYPPRVQVIDFIPFVIICTVGWEADF